MSELTKAARDNANYGTPIAQAQALIAIAEALELIAERTRHPQPTQCSCQKRYG